MWFFVLSVSNDFPGNYKNTESIIDSQLFPKTLFEFYHQWQNFNTYIDIKSRGNSKLCALFLYCMIIVVITLFNPFCRDCTIGHREDLRMLRYRQERLHGARANHPTVSRRLNDGHPACIGWLHAYGGASIMVCGAFPLTANYHTVRDPWQHKGSVVLWRVHRYTGCATSRQLPPVAGTAHLRTLLISQRTCCAEKSWTIWTGQAEMVQLQNYGFNAVMKSLGLQLGFSHPLNPSLACNKCQPVCNEIYKNMPNGHANPKNHLNRKNYHKHFRVDQKRSSRLAKSVVITMMLIRIRTLLHCV